MPLSAATDTYSSLWLKAKEAEKKDLPRTQYDVLRKIVEKAEKERCYGQLLKAELTGASVMNGIAPDSLQPAIDRISARTRKTDDPVLKAVYQTVLHRIATSRPSLKMDEDLALSPSEILVPSVLELLHKTKAASYEPFVIKGVDSDIFENDLLSVIGYELDAYQTLHDFYLGIGNRRAACLTGLEAVERNTFPRQAKYTESAYLHTLDSLLETYGDLAEAGEIAVKKCQYMRSYTDAGAGEILSFIHYATGKWRQWGRISILRNIEQEMTNPQFSVEYDRQVWQPNQPQVISLKNLRNISSLTLTVYKVRGGGDLDIHPGSEEGYKRIRPLLTATSTKVTHAYTGKPVYELHADSLTLEGLPVGVYMLEFTTAPATQTVRHLCYVTDVYTLAEPQPDGQIRYVVVHAGSGQPIAGAHLRIKEYSTYNKYTTVHGVTDSKGEYLHKGASVRREVYAYTSEDQACPELNVAGRYGYHEVSGDIERTQIYTDRSIYRPGQTVHVATIIYKVRQGAELTAQEGKNVTFTLRDANYKVIGEQEAVTDKYGTCHADFVLPSSGLNGVYSIYVNGHSQQIRVEEYKRPTFEVEFPKIDQRYAAGDTVTVTATARTYSGVPVQGANVKYKVVRRLAFWWWAYSRYWGGGYFGDGSGEKEVCSDETQTGDDGTFQVRIPMILPEASISMFYQFVVTADVTDGSGETHSGQMSLPLGNRKTALTVDMADEILAEERPMTTFHLLNAAGNDVDAEARYQIDGGKWQTVRTATPVAVVTTKMKSGKHTLTAVCEGDTLTRDFVVFSLDDKRPAVETDDWFYQSATQFPNDGKPVIIQVGSSDTGVHIIYSVYSGDRVIESGAVDKSNELINWKLTFQEQWGNGVLLTFAWVKNGRCHTHTAQIQRPVPDRKLRMQWKTFRDRLTPGQQEEWSLTVLNPDGTPADAMLMATMYDKSLDQLSRHQWTFSPYQYFPLPYSTWMYANGYKVSETGSRNWTPLSVKNLRLSVFDQNVFPSYYQGIFRRSRIGMVGGNIMMAKAALPMAEMAMEDTAEETSYDAASPSEAKGTMGDADMGTPEIQMRENLNETAFFYPQLVSGADGTVSIRFTLPESLTTWRFMGLAHTTDMRYGMLEGEAVAQKDVMIQPNVPRFLRVGDKATLSAKVMSMVSHPCQGVARLDLVDPRTSETVMALSQPFTVAGESTAHVSFRIDTDALPSEISLLIVRISAIGDTFNDGEQHYLPVLPNQEQVTVTIPFTQHTEGVKTIHLDELPEEARVTLEYTSNPTWLMVQALPSLSDVAENNAIDQAVLYYVNAIGRHLVSQYPQIKTVFDQWRAEQGQETPLMSALEKNEDLKGVLLSETPWVNEAELEADQKKRLADFFDSNTIQYRLNSSVDKLSNLQNEDGSFSWWLGMRGSLYMTLTVAEIFARLQTMLPNGAGQEVASLHRNAIRYLAGEMIKEVRLMKQQERKDKRQVFPSHLALRWLYVCAISNPTLSDEGKAANDYLIKLLRKDARRQTIFEKALTAIVLKDPAYVQSLKEYTVYREELGRYYDTPRASYSWQDYRIPTQVAAIEALQTLSPSDTVYVHEMQRWLLQAKRTQIWDTPINSVNAVYAFLRSEGASLTTGNRQPAIQTDGQRLALPQGTAGLGYVKTPLQGKPSVIEISNPANHTAWGAVYAQYTQKGSEVTDHASSGLVVLREYIGQPAVGQRIVCRLTITADRDYDFVQVQDKRAACLEPVRQLSGYRNGYYMVPKDNMTLYYFNMLPKGEHVIETEYYVDRAGTYETGLCTVKCVYAPEFCGTTHSQTIIVDP